MKKSHCGYRTHSIIIIFYISKLEKRNNNDLLKNGGQSSTFLLPPRDDGLWQAVNRVLRMKQQTDGLGCTSSQVRRPRQSGQKRGPLRGHPVSALVAETRRQRSSVPGAFLMSRVGSGGGPVRNKAVPLRIARAPPAAPPLGAPSPHGEDASPLRGTCEEDSNAWAFNLC